MSAGTETRTLLPQKYGTGMPQSYSFAPPNMGVGADKKSERFSPSSATKRDIAYLLPKFRLTESSDFVFVDEHNRHKRLKGTLFR